MALGDTAHCERCGYALMGLGGKGRCPECGARFDKGGLEGVRFESEAMRRHARGDRALAQAKLWGALGLAFVCVGLGVWGSVSAGAPGWTLLMGLVFGGVFGFGGWVLWQGQKDER